VLRTAGSPASLLCAPSALLCFHANLARPAQSAYYSWKVCSHVFCGGAAVLTARQEYAQAKQVQAHGTR
jgi:hypothetical protein